MESIMREAMDRPTTPQTHTPTSTSTTSPTRPSSRHVRSSSGPVASLRLPSSSSNTATSTSAHRMEPGSLHIPPAPVASNLPMDRELLQRWSSINNTNGNLVASPQRQSPHPRRHASFDSPREVPLPSPSLSPGGMLAAPGIPFFSNYSSGAPSSTSAVSSQTARPSASSSRTDDITADYFPAQPSPQLSSPPSPKTRLSSLSTSSSGSGSTSSSKSRFSMSSPRSSYPYHGARYALFEDNEKPANNTGSGSDWTSQTSPSPSLLEVDSSQDQERKALTAATSDLAQTVPPAPSSSSQFEPNDATLGLNDVTAMTQTTSSLAQPPCADSDAGNLGNGAPTSVRTAARATTIATPIFPFSRPYSQPDAPCRSYPAMQKQATSMGAQDALPRSSTIPPVAHTYARAQVPTPKPMTASEWPDRNSSASLPLPTQIPFHVLPRAAPNSAAGGGEGGEALGGLAAGFGKMNVVDREARIAGDAHADRVRSAHLSEVGSGMGYQQNLQRDFSPYHNQQQPQPVPSSSSSSSTGSLRSADAHYTNITSENGSGPQTSPHVYRPPSISDQRPVSPFRAPQPPPRPSSSPSNQTSPILPLRRSPSQRDASDEFSTDATSYPAPEPPTILAPSVTSPGPFLSHAPPPPDSWIQVETTPMEYKLVVRLPGFRRDGITLATKRRRILHVVADSWENGGGHFERRISFGYDADLVQVRAEFDGEMLRITIPRRPPPVELWSHPRPGPIGRSG
ncbi:hypothetical protein Hypma_002508 [Hypsizygus marmoreus]|uniref:SHSP domain-containing protein n=1 Tax=Hypsizygus marmoreus TaxID=39966 RepID=A0A369J4A8_HYPMA|nr:hypothetical protein Hypma_002508 [Hypsizygus marmoreus]